MKNAKSGAVLSVVDDIRQVPAKDWNALVGDPGGAPFLEHGFLSSLESSGSASGDNGWYPRHFLLRLDGVLVAAAPAYVKTHSMGEFVFDQGLAAAASELGLDYYPKLVATIPFTPAPGYRFPVHPDMDESTADEILLSGMEQFVRQNSLHSLSLLFVDPEWDFPRNLPAGEAGWLEWAHQYFLWENPGDRDFETYLGRFNKNQRRNIRRERRSVRDQGFSIETLSGDRAGPELADLMYDLYCDTNEQFGPWAAFFLNRQWFHDVLEHWGERILFFLARNGETGTISAMSMLARSRNTLVGRYWGSRETVRNLHFELCYYAPQEYALRQGLRWFDPGMGSPHKARRGFASREFSSWHRFLNPEISALFSSVLSEANEAERLMIRELNDSVPWKKSSGNPGA